MEITQKNEMTQVEKNKMVSLKCSLLNGQILINKCIGDCLDCLDDRQAFEAQRKLLLSVCNFLKKWSNIDNYN